MEPLVPIVLLVDEDAKERALATALLKRGGCSVVAARDGPDALETFSLHATDISLVLLDAQVRPVAGVALAEAIRDLRPDVPIILAARSDASISTESLAACPQIVMVLQKPLRYDEVGLLIRKTLAERIHIARCAEATTHLSPHAPTHAASHATSQGTSHAAEAHAHTASTAAAPARSRAATAATAAVVATAAAASTPLARSAPSARSVPSTPPAPSTPSLLSTPVRASTLLEARKGAPSPVLHWPPTEEDLEAIEVVDAETLRPIHIDAVPLPIALSIAIPVAAPEPIEPVEPVEPVALACSPPRTLSPALPVPAPPARRELPARRLARQTLVSTLATLCDPQSRRMAAAVFATGLGVGFATFWEASSGSTLPRTLVETPIGLVSARLIDTPPLAARSLPSTLHAPKSTPSRSIAAQLTPPHPDAETPSAAVAHARNTRNARNTRGLRNTRVAVREVRARRNPAIKGTVATARRATPIPTPTPTRSEPRDAAVRTIAPALSQSSELRPSASGSRRAAVMTGATGANQETASIYATLGQYRAAYQRLDVNAARAVWPSVDTRALARAFRGLREQEVVFKDCNLAIKTAEATAICGGRATFVTRVGSQTPRSEPREWTFRLKKAGDVWMITQAATAAGATP